MTLAEIPNQKQTELQSADETIFLQPINTCTSLAHTRPTLNDFKPDRWGGGGKVHLL